MKLKNVVIIIDDIEELVKFYIILKQRKNVRNWDNK